MVVGGRFEHAAPHDDAKCPMRAAPGLAGFDICSSANFHALPHEAATAPRCIAAKPPKGARLRVMPWPRLATEKGAFCCCADDAARPGCIGGARVHLVSASSTEHCASKHSRAGSAAFEKHSTPAPRQAAKMKKKHLRSGQLWKHRSLALATKKRSAA